MAKEVRRLLPGTWNSTVQGVGKGGGSTGKGTEWTPNHNMRKSQQGFDNEGSKRQILEGKGQHIVQITVLQIRNDVIMARCWKTARHDITVGDDTKREDGKFCLHELRVWGSSEVSKRAHQGKTAGEKVRDGGNFGNHPWVGDNLGQTKSPAQQFPNQASQSHNHHPQLSKGSWLEGSPLRIHPLPAESCHYLLHWSTIKQVSSWCFGDGKPKNWISGKSTREWTKNHLKRHWTNSKQSRRRVWKALKARTEKACRIKGSHQPKPLRTESSPFDLDGDC